MKRILLLIAGFAISTGVTTAQPWLKNTDVSKKKFSDIVADYRAEQLANASEEEEEYENGEKKEGKGYHFDRWVWYWERHLDENGYMVSPLKNMEEWRKWRLRTSRSQNKTTDASNWTFQGPDKGSGGNSVLGRINIIAFHPTDTNTFWIGSAGGGAWKTTDNGLSWAVVNDYFPVLGVSDIDFNPLNPNTIYLCTGDRDAGDTYSIGVLKSTDGGITWDTTALRWQRTDFALANSMVINPADTNSLTLATTKGIYKSFDAGTTWNMVQTGSYKQILYAEADTNVLFAAGSPGGVYQVMRSADGGSSWQAVTSFSTNSRLMIAVTKADPKIVKLVVANVSYGLLGIYNSTDTGKTFTQIFNDGNNCETNILASSPKGDKCGGQGWYDISIAISPLDADEVVVGGVNTWYSHDGGVTWDLSNQWTSSVPGVTIVHADKHYHKYHPLRPAHLYECNDGGIFFTADAAGNIWNDISNGLGITQFYRNAVAGNASFVIGGSQDNGTKKLDNGVSTFLTGGDGMDCQIDYSDSKIFYTSQQYGEIRRTINGGGNFTDISNKIPGGQPKGDWITPFIIDPKDPSIIFAGFDILYRSMDRGESWEALTSKYPNLIKRVARANDNNHIYFIANNRVNVSEDYGKNWNSIPNPYSGTISDITVDPENPKHIWITLNGYTPQKVADYTPDDGWKDQTSQLPNIPANCIAIDPLDARIYIGTDLGVFVKHPTETNWQSYISGLPNAEIIDLGINNTSGEIWAATYGRGMWKSPLESFPLNITSIPYATDAITIAPNPNSGHFTILTSDKTGKQGQLTLNITGMNGTTVLKREVSLNSAGAITVDATLAKGIYIVNLQKGNVIIARSKMLIN